MPAKKQEAPKKGSKGVGRYVYCPMSNQTHQLFAVEVKRSNKTGSLWFKCICGTRGYLDHGELPVMTHKDAIEAGAILPFSG
jgi:hypothetical protein